MGNILQNSFDVTYEDFLKGVFGVKQEFALEKARVRTFKRLENVFSLCVLAYVSRRSSSAKRRFRTVRMPQGKSPKRFWTARKCFFAQCFQGLRENPG